MEELQKSAMILWNSMNTRTTRVLHSLSGQHVLGMKQLVLREKEQTQYGGVMLVILVLGGGEGLEQVAHHQFKASLAYLVSGQP